MFSAGMEGVAHDVGTEQLAYFLVVEVLLQGQRGDETAGQIGQDPGLAVDLLAGQLPSSIGEDLVGDHGAGGGLLRPVGGGHASGVHQFSDADDVANLILGVAGLLDAIVLGHQGGRAGQALGGGGLAPGVGVAVEVGKHNGQEAGIGSGLRIGQTVHEDAVIGHEHIVKDGQGLHIAHVGNRGIDVGALMAQAGQSADLDAGPVSGQRKGNRIRIVMLGHKFSGAGHDLIHIGSRRVTGLCAPNDNALAWLSIQANTVHVGLHDT